MSARSAILTAAWYRRRADGDFRPVESHTEQRDIAREAELGERTLLAEYLATVEPDTDWRDGYRWGARQALEAALLLPGLTDAQRAVLHRLRVERALR